MTLSYSLAPLLLFVLGLAFGSFGNVVIWRLPRGESLSYPPSHCPRCDSPIAWYDNLPLVGWLRLRGRCRNCSEPISPRYPLVELASGLLWVLAWAQYGVSARTAFAIVLYYLLLLLTFIDLDTMRLPNKLVGLLALAGVAGVAVAGIARVPAVPLMPASGLIGGQAALFSLMGLLLGAVPVLLVSLVYSALRGRNGLGMGDVKLLAVLGLFLGPYVVLALMIGALVGAVIGIAVTRGDTRRKLPFGPYLALGAIVTVIVGEPLVAWYLSLL